MTDQTLQDTVRDFWIEREEKCLSIIRQALILLRETLLRQPDDFPKTEIGLNRELYSNLLAATQELYPNDEIIPVADCNNQPDLNDKARIEHEHKRPDFQWIYRDIYESDPNRSRRQFVVECKRLGTPSSVGWVFNRNYSKHGVERFRNSKWAYGKLMQSGAMVGYCQSMERSDILQEVNDGCKIDHLPALTLIDISDDQITSLLRQMIQRKFKISPFILHHLWVDLRH